MNKQKWIAVCVVVTMIASAASALVGLKSREEIGEPGIKVGMGELLYPGEQIVLTNCVILPEKLSGYTSRLAEVSDIELKSLPADTTFGRRIYSAPDGFESLMSVVEIRRIGKVSWSSVLPKGTQKMKRQNGKNEIFRVRHPQTKPSNE